MFRYAVECGQPFLGQHAQDVQAGAGHQPKFASDGMHAEWRAAAPEQA
jgi:hypothetical protein